MVRLFPGNDIKEKLVWLLSAAVSLLVILEVFASLDDKQIYIYFNSDTLYLPSIFRDLFIDHSGFRGWHLNGAPNFFPDMTFYFLVNTLLPDFRSAMLVYSVLQYLGIMLLVRWLFRTVVPAISERELALANLVMLVIFLVTFYPGDFVFTFYLLSISYHLGAFIMTLLALIFTFRFLASGNRVSFLLLFLISLTGVVNDKLFIAMYVLPFFSLLLFLYAPSLRKKILLLTCNAVIATVLGTLIYNAIKHSGYIHIISLSWKFMNFDNIPSSFHTMTGQHLTYLRALDFRSLTILLSILSFLITLFFSFRFLRHFFRSRSLPQEDILPALYLTFSLAFWVVVLATPVINGSYVGYAILRYNIYAIYLSLFNYGVLYHLWQRRGGKILSARLGTAVLTILFVVVLLPGLRPLFSGGLKKITRHYPAIAKEMDELAGKEDLHYGLATYWHAKYITMFSVTGLRIYTVNDDLTPWYHVTNEHWYRRGSRGRYGDPAFTFVLMDGMDTLRVKEKLGPPLRTLPFRGSSITLYPPFCFDKQKKVVFLEK